MNFRLLFRELTFDNSLVAEHSADNKMTAENLARVFTPSLLAKETDLTMSHIDEIQLAENVVVFLITHYRDIFSSVRRHAARKCRQCPH